MKSKMAKSLVPLLVQNNLHPLPKPLFQQAVHKIKQGNTEKVHIHSRLEQERYYKRMQKLDMVRGTIICISDAVNGRAARNFLANFIEDYLTDTDIKATWLTLVKDEILGGYIDTRYEDLIIIDRLYAENVSYTRVEVARDIIANAKEAVIFMISSENSPFLFSDKLGIPCSVFLNINHIDEIEV